MGEILNIRGLCLIYNIIKCNKKIIVIRKTKDTRKCFSPKLTVIGADWPLKKVAFMVSLPKTQVNSLQNLQSHLQTNSFTLTEDTMKKISDLVNHQLTQSVKSYDKLSLSVYEMLHLNKEKHNLWVVVKQQQLTLLTDNPYLGTQLRYEQDNIRNALNRQYLLELKKSKVKIVPPTAKRQRIKEKRFVITTKTTKILGSIADEIEDKELRDSLKNLGK